MESYLYHHGILGQRWGKKNGPPYPLDAEDHSAREKKAGWRKSLDKEGDHGGKKRASKGDGEKRKGLSDKQKRALKIGGALLLTSVAAYGTYKYASMHPETVQRGKDLLNKALGKSGQDDVIILDDDSFSLKDAGTVLNDAGDMLNKGSRKIHETIERSLQNANPLHGTAEGENNCTSCAVAGILRTLGFDATSKSTGGQRQNLGGILESCFKGIKVLDGSAVKFGKSPEDAAEMLVKRFGNNARGVVGVNWKGKNFGHAFSWVIENGKVQFLDFQNYWDDNMTRRFWQQIDKNGPLTLAALDNLEINMDELSKWVNIE